jgi:hypothetical protein
VDVVGRFVARRQGKALVTRTAFSLSADPESVFAIAPIKMVSEELVQSIAYGAPSGKPAFVTRWNPLSRDTGELEPFAKALDEYFAKVLQAKALPRIWLPHGSALTLVELLGHRYRTNKNASPELQRMGWQCRVIAEEAKYEGQQVVAVARELLRSHVLTGQAPIKDGHLGALLAWIVPKQGEDPAVEADLRALVPASGVLTRQLDDRVETLRKIAKGGGKAGAKARMTIENILRTGAELEWKLLLDAWRAFWKLGLAHHSAVEDLVHASAERTKAQLERSYSPAKMPDALARELERHEYSAELAGAVAVASDDVERELARRKGRVIATEVTAIRQPKPKYKPCTLDLTVLQDVLRVRPGTALKQLGGKVEGRVASLRENNSGQTIFSLEVETGVRSIPAAGTSVDWTDQIAQDMSYSQGEVYKSIKAKQNPLIFQKDLQPAATKRAKKDLLLVAERLRKA